MKLPRGAVIIVSLSPTVGREQKGVRPCVIVSDPEVIKEQRFPLVCVVPVTGTAARGLLYPRLHPGRSGLTKESFALIDHIRAIDKRRIRGVYGMLPPQELQSIDEGLAAFLGLHMRPDSPAAGAPIQ